MDTSLTATRASASPFVPTPAERYTTALGPSAAFAARVQSAGKNALDKAIARRRKKAVERFAETGAGNVKKLRDYDPPEYRLRVGDWRIRFQQDHEIVRVIRVRNRREAYR